MPNFAEKPAWAYEDALAAMEALSALVVDAFDTGEDHARIARGVAVLFEQQTSVLKEAGDFISRTVSEAAARPEVGVRTVVPAGINMVMVTEPDGRRIMTTPELAGVDRGGVTKFRFEDGPSDLIADAIKEGYDTAKIAEATNLNPKTVERVVEQLLAQSRKHDHPATEQRAVNE